MWRPGHNRLDTIHRDPNTQLGAVGNKASLRACRCDLCTRVPWHRLSGLCQRERLNTPVKRKPTRVSVIVVARMMSLTRSTSQSCQSSHPFPAFIRRTVDRQPSPACRNSKAAGVENRRLCHFPIRCRFGTSISGGVQSARRGRVRRSVTTSLFDVADCDARHKNAASGQQSRQRTPAA